MLNKDDGLSISIGTDIVEIDRFRDLQDESPFYHRIFSEKELAYCRGFSDPTPHLAATFAGKEAVLKAVASNCGISLGDIEILRNDAGVPHVVLHQDCTHEIHVSLSHSSSYAVAVALAAKGSNAPDLNEVRGLLDEKVKQILPRSETL
jgi:holo-[acyl-carrier protein] synthase